MHEICRFLGIVIYMLYDDHRPPHFHADGGSEFREQSRARKEGVANAEIVSITRIPKKGRDLCG